MRLGDVFNSGHSSFQIKRPEAEQILSYAYEKVLGETLSRVELLLCWNRELAESTAGEIQKEFLQMSRSRAAGTPLQYLLGSQTFLDHEYCVGPGVLIPRPETEVLVRVAIEKLSSPSLRGLEIGLGSGVLSIELLTKFPSLSMVASELSDEALVYAQKNILKLLGNSSHQRLRIVRPIDPSEVFEPFQRESLCPVDFIISNPPYLAHSCEAEAQVLLHEPHQALFAPEGDSLFFYRELAHGGSAFLKEGGWVFAEIPHERATEIRNLFNSCWEVELLQDLTGRDRVLVAKKKGLIHGQN